MDFNKIEECTKSELDLFSKPPIQTSIEEGKWDKIDAEDGFDKNDNIIFKINSTDTHYLDLSETNLCVKCKLVKVNDTTILDTDKISTVNNFLHSLFKQIKVKLNNKDVENSNGNYAYRAYLENLLTFNTDEKKTFLKKEGWIDDDDYQFDSTFIKTTLTETANNGFLARRNLFLNQTHGVEFFGKIHSDVFNINRALLSQVDVMLSLVKNSPKFFLLSENETTGPGFKVVIESAYLLVRRLSVSPSVMMGHTMALQKTNAKYPIKRVIVKEFIKHVSSLKFTENNLHNGIMPNRVLVGLLESDQAQGLYAKNPYKFQHFSATSIDLTAASLSLPYTKPLEFNYDKNNYVEAYNTLFSNLKGINTNITYEGFKGGSTLYAFDLTPDLCNDTHYSIMKSGTLSLDVKFDKVINNSVTAIVYMEFDNMIEIDDKRNIYTDYSL